MQKYTASFNKDTENVLNPVTALKDTVCINEFRELNFRPGQLEEKTVN